MFAMRKLLLAFTFMFCMIIVTINLSAKDRWIPSKPDYYQINLNQYHHLLNLKFIEGSDVRLRNGKLISYCGYDLIPFYNTLTQYNIKSLKRLFSRSEEYLEARRQRGQLRSGKQLGDLNNYYRIVLDENEDSEKLINELLKLTIVETVYPESKVILNEDIPPQTPDFSGEQGYLYSAPEGIDALASWRIEDGMGEGVKIMDIEGSWNVDHEDFKEPFYIQMEDLQPDCPHGDAMLGMMIAQHNGYGLNGICPNAGIGCLSVWDFDWNNADLINEAAANLDEGDIFVILWSTAVMGVLGTPIDAEQAAFDAIETASANGIIPVTAAGNGTWDLDDDMFRDVYNPDVRHSGMIYVGAGNPPSGNHGPPRSLTNFTCFGQCLDVQGWGFEIVTGGRGDLFFSDNDTLQWYTSEFGGTCGASGMVVGALACLQGIYKSRNDGETLNSQEIRDILVETGTPQNREGRQGHIGPQPNLLEAIEFILTPGLIYGTVIDAETRQALPGAEIITNIDTTNADENGNYSVRYIRMLDEFALTFSAPGFNDTTIIDLDISEGDTLELDIFMLHPEFSPSLQVVNVPLHEDDEVELHLRVENSGNGLLEWRFEKRLPGDAGLEPWVMRENMFAGDSLDDYQLNGVVFADGQFYISGSNQGNPTIYILDQDGIPAGTFAQPGESNSGMNDLAFDGELIWGSIEDVVFGMSIDVKLLKHLKVLTIEQLT